MKNYLLNIESNDQKEWVLFRETYKQKKLGNNINEAIFSLIKKTNRRK